MNLPQTVDSGQIPSHVQPCDKIFFESYFPMNFQVSVNPDYKVVRIWKCSGKCFVTQIYSSKGLPCAYLHIFRQRAASIHGFVSGWVDQKLFVWLWGWRQFPRFNLKKFYQILMSSNMIQNLSEYPWLFVEVINDFDKLREWDIIISIEI